MVALQNWVNQARVHWKEFRPTLYRDLKATGKLEAALKDAAERTFAEMGQLRAMGYNEQERGRSSERATCFCPRRAAIRIAATARCGSRTSRARLTSCTRRSRAGRGPSRCSTPTRSRRPTSRKHSRSEEQRYDERQSG